MEIEKNGHPCRTGPAATSQGNDFFANKVQTNDLWGTTFGKMAVHGIANLPVQALQVIGLGEDGLSQGTCHEPPFRGVVYQEDDFTHKKMIAQLLAPPRADTARDKTARQEPLNKSFSVIASALFVFNRE